VELGRRYFQWLPGLFLGWIQVTWGQDIRIRFLGLTLLSLRPATQTPEESAFEVTGGLLCRVPGGHLRFVRRESLVVTSLEGYRPALPRWLYQWTQARLHDWVMNRFAAMLSRAVPEALRA
jgi:hypothetical protein